MTRAVAAEATERTTNPHVPFGEVLFEIQNASSQCIAPFLDILEPDMHIIETHVPESEAKHFICAALFQNKPRASPLWKSYLHKPEELLKKAQRNRANHITTFCIKDREAISDLHDMADCLLIYALFKFRCTPTQAGYEM